MIGHGAHVPVDGCLILGTFRNAEANPKHHIARSSSSMCDDSRSVDIQPLPSWSSQNRRRFLSRASVNFRESIFDSNFIVLRSNRTSMGPSSPR